MYLCSVIEYTQNFIVPTKLEKYLISDLRKSVGEVRSYFIRKRFKSFICFKFLFSNYFEKKLMTAAGLNYALTWLFS
jgi:hypothetical protein